MPDYAQYQQEIEADIAETLQRFQCQPILFIGSGFSLRYASGPNWEALLTQLAQACPTIDKDFAYFKPRLFIRTRDDGEVAGEAVWLLRRSPWPVPWTPRQRPKWPSGACVTDRRNGATS